VLVLLSLAPLINLANTIWYWFSRSHDSLDAGTVSAKFGTAPSFWNALLGLMAKLSSSFLSNEDLMSKLAVRWQIPTPGAHLLLKIKLTSACLFKGIFSADCAVS
jgi:hypothetical protein